MKALSFPTFLYHAEHAPHGKIFQAESEVPTDGGWVDNPAKFAADYVAPADVEPADGSVPAWHPEQALTVREAVEAYTRNPAFAAHEEALKGSITEGKLADLVVLSRDILRVPVAEITRAEVLYTIVGGKVVYQKGTATSQTWEKSR